MRNELTLKQQTMIKKFAYIKSIAVFQDFIWNNQLDEFKRINLIYGRNGSGKTTLSRILRMLETGTRLVGWENADFCVEWTTGKRQSSLVNLTSYERTVRVFNKDFICENLSFLNDTRHTSGKENALPTFALLGAENQEVTQKIEALRKKLGDETQDSESGIYACLRRVEKERTEIASEEMVSSKDLEDMLKKKATGQKTGGIKYNPLYRLPNYDKTRLLKDIEVVLKDDFIPCANEEVDALEEITKKEHKPIAGIVLKKFWDSWQDLYETVKKIVEKKINESGKIQELASDFVLNQWVKQAMNLHSSGQICSFCGNVITDERWQILTQHFDEESRQLELQIQNTRADIGENLQLLQTWKTEYEKLEAGFDTASSETQLAVRKLCENFVERCGNYEKLLQELLQRLQQRESSIARSLVFKELEDMRASINDVYNKIEELRLKFNEDGDSLAKQQNEAREKLRLKEVWEFAKQINYSERKKKIERCQEKKKQKQAEEKELQDEINDLRQKISEAQAKLHDEKLAAEKVNQFLAYSRTCMLSLEVLEGNQEKHSCFVIKRGEQFAYNLSEGECSLIAFCYFLAKLQEVNIGDQLPIIWIDDPISSLDANHIFTIYALLRGEIVDCGKYKQIFISTHNLQFLKYLNRLKGDGGKSQFLLEKSAEDTTGLRKLPDYLLRETEYVYLFGKIYQCAFDPINDHNFEAFYDFGNNARRFLEIYGYFWLPETESKFRATLFGDTVIYQRVDRFLNEFSHSQGTLDRAALPIDYEEIKGIANDILNAIRQKDKEQYEALVLCVTHSKEK